jgi:hypothetical protein
MKDDPKLAATLGRNPRGAQKKIMLRILFGVRLDGSCFMQGVKSLMPPFFW